MRNVRFFKYRMNLIKSSCQIETRGDPIEIEKHRGAARSKENSRKRKE